MIVIEECPAIRASVNTLTVPDKLDLIWTSQNYHDLKNGKEADTALVNKAAFAALKPGGLYIILDHAAADGSGLRDTNTLHRIDEAAVKAEVTAAGFDFVGNSDVLRNPADARNLVVWQAKAFQPQGFGATLDNRVRVGIAHLAQRGEVVWGEC